MTKIILRVLFILSISLNIAFAFYFFNIAASPVPGNPLRLSETQEKEVAEIRLGSHRQNETIKQKIIKCRERLLAALKEEKVDKATVHGCIEKIAGLQKELQKNTVEEILKLKGVLDARQCNCLMENIDARMQGSTAPCDGECCKQTEKKEIRKKEIRK